MKAGTSTILFTAASSTAKKKLTQQMLNKIFLEPFILPWNFNLLLHGSTCLSFIHLFAQPGSGVSFCLTSHWPDVVTWPYLAAREAGK